MRIDFKTKTVKTKKRVTTFNNIFWWVIIRGSLFIGLTLLILLLAFFNHLINMI